MVTIASRTGSVRSCLAILFALLLAPVLFAGDDTTRPVLGGNRADLGGPEVGGVQTGFGPAPIFSHKGHGSDFVKAGFTTRSTVTHPGVPGVFCPFPLFVPPLPAPAIPVAVFVSWNWLLDGAAPPVDMIGINGVPIVGDLCGTGSPDLCWGKAGAATYLAEIDPAVSPVIHGGVNIIMGACDKPLGFDPLAFGEGISILCVYDIVPTVPADFRTVDVYCGYTSTESSPVRIATGAMCFSNVYHGGDFHFFLNALDGQDVLAGGFPDEFFINGIAVGGVVAGTGAPGDAWKGFLGLAPSNNLYDHANDDLGPLGLIPLGSLCLSFATDSHIFAGYDCIGHSFGAVSFPTKETWLPWSPGKKCASTGVVPKLEGFGKVISGSPDVNDIVLTMAPPFAPATLVVGFSPLRAPFKGGILGPFPNVLIGPIPTSAAGVIDLPFLMPAGIPPCTMLWMQYWIVDPPSTFGLCASNTIKMTTQ